MNGANITERALQAIQAGAQRKLQQHQQAAPWPALHAIPELLEDLPQPFPFDGLGPILGPAARAIADAVQAPDALAGGSVLAAAAVAAQSHADVVMPHGQAAPLSVFVIGAADSGARKSVVDSVACQPIEEQRRKDARSHAEKAAAHKAEKAARRPGEQGDDPPTARAIVVSKATTEGLHHLLRTQSHVGLFSPEGAEVIGGHSMRDEKKSAAIAWLLKAWGGETLDSLTRGDGLSMLVGRRVSMHVLMQPVILQTLMADPLAQGQGWIARSLIAAPVSLAGTRLFRDDQPDALTLPEVIRYHAAVNKLLNTAPPVHPDGDGLELVPRRLPLSAGARALWIEFYDEAERQQADDGELAGVRAWASKAAEHAARIAGVVAITADINAAEVPAHAMEGALSVASFYLSEHVRLMGQSQQRLSAGRLHTLVAWLHDRGARVRHADVLQRTPRALRDLKADGINALLSELERRAYIRRAGDDWEVRRA